MSRYIDAEKIKFEPIDIIVKGITRRTIERMATETEIDAMPTADVEEVRHGIADIIAENAGIDDAINVSECSCCERTILTWGGEYPQFCSHCGAKMDGGEE